jgi:hypothetical protein
MLAEEMPGGVGPPDERVMYKEVVGRLFWVGPAEPDDTDPADAGAAPPPPAGMAVPLSALTVKFATVLQLGPIVALRHQRVRAFVADALGLPRPVAAAGPGAAPPVVPPAIVEALAHVRLLRVALWKFLRWENGHKEVWWRLAVDGFPNNARMHRADAPCHCGGPAPADRMHHFWTCCVAESVRAEISAQLPAGAPAVTRAQLWLMQPPPGIHAGVWRVVCLAAIEAMNKGKNLMGWWAARAMQGGPLAPGPAAASRRAVALFWSLLDDFAGAPWGIRVDKKPTFVLPADHPFFRGSSMALAVVRI